MNRAEMVRAFAKMVYAMAWADLQEATSVAKGSVDLGDFEHVSFGGCEIYDLIGETPEVAIRYAEDSITRIETLSGAQLPDLYAKVCENDPGCEGPDRFCSDLAHETCGSGVGWADDNAPHGLTVPYREGLYYGDLPEADALPPAFWEWIHSH